MNASFVVVKRCIMDTVEQICLMKKHSGENKNVFFITVLLCQRVIITNVYPQLIVKTLYLDSRGKNVHNVVSLYQGRI